MVMFTILRHYLHCTENMPISSVNMPKKPQETADLVTLSEEIVNGKLHYLCSVRSESNPFTRFT